MVDLSSINKGKNLHNTFASSRRRNIKKAISSNLYFTEIQDHSEIVKFHKILTKNLEKFDKKPVHSVDELFDLQSRLKSNVKFFGVYSNEILLSSYMVFLFDKNVFHTQYISMDYSFSAFRPNDFMNYKLINLAIDLKYNYFSFGTCAYGNGEMINSSLCKIKEDFGGIGSNNSTYFKDLSYLGEND